MTKVLTFLKGNLYLILLSIIILYLSYASFGEGVNFYFWKDDWFLKWAGKYNPDSFFLNFPFPVFRAPDYYIQQWILDSQVKQYLGLFIKAINSFILYVFINSIFKSKKTAIYGSLLYASFSGGLEAYTWVTWTGVLIGFTLLGFLFFNKVLVKFNFVYFVLAAFFLSIATLLYFGRALGIFPVVLFWTILHFAQKNKINFFRLVFYLSVSVGTLIIVMNLLAGAVSGLNWDTSRVNNIFKDYSIFLNSIGNLIRNPYYRIYELGSLTANDTLSIKIGYAFVSFFIVSIACFSRLKSRFWMYCSVFSFWVLIFYFFNWVYGGGSTSTLVGSTHRYVALSAIGVIIMTSLLIEKLQIGLGVVACIFLIAVNLNYSNYVIDIESKVRDRRIVEPIYEGIVTETNYDKEAQVLIIDTPNELKSFVVQGWYPYKYAYDVGIVDLTSFPTVFPHWGSGLKWICSENEERKLIETSVGVVHYQAASDIDINHIYGWELSDKGELKNKTDKLRQQYLECSTQAVGQP